MCHDLRSAALVLENLPLRESAPAHHTTRAQEILDKFIEDNVSVKPNTPNFEPCTLNLKPET